MKVLLINQVFYPDVASTAQHASDLACSLAASGHEVTVVASRRAYEEAGRMFPAEEVWKGVRILRVLSLGLGKNSNWRRTADFVSFLAACGARLLRLPKFDVIVTLTSPPLIALLSSLIVHLKGGRMLYWMMDLNPDQAIAAGLLGPRQVVSRLLNRTLRFCLNSADRIVVLDRFMRDRILVKGNFGHKIALIPPWSHDHTVGYSQQGRDEFRLAHGLDGKFVVMYSGNHSPCHPLDTLVEAASALLAQRPDIRFCFVGGGTEHSKIERVARERGLCNIVCLPYQPLDALSASLSSADLHTVVLGAPFLGIVHPCKIYNILNLAIPVLYIGPAESHITDLAPPAATGKWFYSSRHGDVQGLIRNILSAASATASNTTEERSIGARFSQASLMEKLVAEIESLAPADSRVGSPVTGSPSPIDVVAERRG